MGGDILGIIRALVAIQVAIFEIYDGDFDREQNIKAIDKCMNELQRRVENFKIKYKQRKQDE
jgi:hypothetical protein